MDKSKYYNGLKKLARTQRASFSICGPTRTKTEIKDIFKHYGVSVDLWPMAGMNRSKLKNLRGAYINDGQNAHVMISRNLPDEQQIFTMAHELKHHLVDSDEISGFCHTSNNLDVIEIGAEIFAAEFIYPEQDFISDLEEMGVNKGECTASDLVKLKHEKRASLSYSSLSKRAEFTGLAESGSMPKVGWKKLETEIYGEPDYIRIQRYRKQKQRMHG